MYLQLKDLFKITCRSCGSERVDLTCECCEICGYTIGAVCNECGSNFDYHKFLFKEEEGN